MLLGKIPAVFLPFLFGANLVALCKPDAVGSVFHRLTSKAACFSLSDDLGQFLRPMQLDFKTPGGCKAAVHAACQFLALGSADSPKIFLKLDYKNTFNNVRKDCLLPMVKEHFSSLYPLVWQAYSLPSNLFLRTPLFYRLLGFSRGILWAQPSSV